MDLLTTQTVRDLANQIQLCQVTRNKEDRSDDLVRLWSQARTLGVLDLVEIELFSRSGFFALPY